MAEEREPTNQVVRYLDGDKEETDWISRAGHAHVTYTEEHGSHGDVFEGHFNEAGQRHGEGQYVYAANEEAGRAQATYTGNFAEGKKHGHGVFAYPDGTSYEGQWAANVRSGPGTFTYANGDKYSGAWRNGVKHGEGAYVYGDGSQLVGTWANGAVVEGKRIFPDRSSFHGKFAQPGEEGLAPAQSYNPYPTGEGLYFFGNGNQQEVEFVTTGDDGEPLEEGAAPRQVNGQVSALHAKLADLNKPSVSATGATRNAATGDYEPFVMQRAGQWEEDPENEGGYVLVPPPAEPEEEEKEGGEDGEGDGEAKEGGEGGEGEGEGEGEEKDGGEEKE